MRWAFVSSCRPRSEPSLCGPATTCPRVMGTIAGRCRCPQRMWWNEAAASRSLISSLTIESGSIHQRPYKPCGRSKMDERLSSYTFEGTPRDKAILLANTQRAQDHHLPRGSGPRLSNHACRHQCGGSVHARVSSLVAEQSNAGDCRYVTRRWWHTCHGLRIRGRPSLSCREDGPLSAKGLAQAKSRSRVVVLANGWTWTDVGAEPSLLPVRSRENPLCS